MSNFDRTNHSVISKLSAAREEGGNSCRENLIRWCQIRCATFVLWLNITFSNDQNYKRFWSRFLTIVPQHFGLITQNTVFWCFWNRFLWNESVLHFCFNHLSNGLWKYQPICMFIGYDTIMFESQGNYTSTNAPHM